MDYAKEIDKINTSIDFLFDMVSSTAKRVNAIIDAIDAADCNDEDIMFEVCKETDDCGCCKYKDECGGVFPEDEQDDDEFEDDDDFLTYKERAQLVSICQDFSCKYKESEKIKAIINMLYVNGLLDTENVLYFIEDELG